ncbi:cytochrome P450 6B4-like [Anabrus simplex]|uniref:cytochrome P450 6B4-like n=1 Tax=Anabrus simplex TaxID=316456 RepID=UPI0035A2822C
MAGFETTSTTMSFCLHELAVNPDIQRRLQEEIDSTLLEYGGKITYEAIQKMEYLDRVVSETLRKYPPVSILSRKCTLDYTIPGTNVRLDKGTRVIIPVFAIQRDSRYYSEPEQFDPERFTEENKAQRHNCTYLPFGEGPRICIGMRFGLQQTKLGLVTLLSKFQFSACSKTDNPPRLDPKALVTASISGAWLRINLRPPTTSGH